ncbi:MAG: response regulator [Candidatus Paceibacterota bacterium]|nr:response regulator [Candidatus Paceibacterota bacterium]
MKKILLVEDDSFLSNIYSIKLKEAGFSVELAFSGEEAVKKAKEQKPDLILLDIILPGISGWEALEKIRKEEGPQGSKVLVLSNLDKETEIDKGTKLGVVKHLVKAHYTPSDIIEEIKETLKR